MDLLERDIYLRALHDSLRRVAAGQGELVFLGGEAGIGKSTLIEQFLDEALTDATSFIVSCDGSAVPGPLGPLLDIAEALGPEVERLLAEQAPRDGIFRAVLRAFRALSGPTIIVGEDAHWVDEATLELIRFLGRRIGTTSVQFIIAYRNDELGAYHPLRRVLGDLTNASSVHRIDLKPLSREAVSILATGTGIDPVELYERTGGNPFFVTETISSGAKGVPATVRDAVLARASRLSPEGRAVLDASAVLPTPFDPGLLAAVIGTHIDDSLEECLTVGMLRPVDQGIAFRHAISRDAILASMSIARSRALHRRVLEAMQQEPGKSKNNAQLAYHAEQAGDREATLQYATAAARLAATFGAHREAAAQYGRALRFASDEPLEARLELMEARAFECYLTGDTAQAIQIQEDVVDLCKDLGDPLRQGDNTRKLSRFSWFGGRVADATRYAQEAHALLAALPPGPELAMAWSNLSQLCMLAKDNVNAIEWGERAIALATEHDEKGILVHAMTNVGTARYSQGDDAGRIMLEEAAHLGRTHNFDDDAVRALTNRGYTAWTLHELDLAERFLDEGIAYAAGRDLVAMELYQRSARALLLLEKGDWDRARQEAESVCSLPAAVAGTRIMALICRGRLRALLRQEPDGLLDEALNVSRQTGELQRLGPVMAARAEAAWLAGEMDGIVPDLRETYQQAIALGDSWISGELALWLHRAGIPIETVTADLPEPYALEIGGDAHGAANAWKTRGYPLESARARASSGQEDDLREALDAFERLEARADIQCVTRQLRDLGARNIPRGPRPATRANAGNLTARELDVLELLAKGVSNREIAEQLYLSVKTVGHHVSAILAKFDVASRGDAVRYAEAQGLLQHRESPSAK